MTIALVIPPQTVKNRGGCALIRDRALNQANTVPASGSQGSGAKY